MYSGAYMDIHLSLQASCAILRNLTLVSSEIRGIIGCSFRIMRLFTRFFQVTAELVTHGREEPVLEFRVPAGAESLVKGR